MTRSLVALLARRGRGRPAGGRLGQLLLRLQRQERAGLSLHDLAGRPVAADLGKPARPLLRRPPGHDSRRDRLPGPARAAARAELFATLGFSNKGAGGRSAAAIDASPLFQNNAGARPGADTVGAETPSDVVSPQRGRRTGADRPLVDRPLVDRPRRPVLDRAARSLGPAAFGTAARPPRRRPAPDRRTMHSPLRLLLIGSTPQLAAFGQRHCGAGLERLGRRRTDRRRGRSDALRRGRLRRGRARRRRRRRRCGRGRCDRGAGGAGRGRGRARGRAHPWLAAQRRRGRDRPGRAARRRRLAAAAVRGRAAPPRAKLASWPMPPTPAPGLPHRRQLVEHLSQLLCPARARPLADGGARPAASNGGGRRRRPGRAPLPQDRGSPARRGPRQRRRRRDRRRELSPSCSAPCCPRPTPPGLRPRSAPRIAAPILVGGSEHFGAGRARHRPLSAGRPPGRAAAAPGPGPGRGGAGPRATPGRPGCRTRAGELALSPPTTKSERGVPPRRAAAGTPPPTIADSPRARAGPSCETRRIPMRPPTSVPAFLEFFASKGHTVVPRARSCRTTTRPCCSPTPG